MLILLPLSHESMWHEVHDDVQKFTLAKWGKWELEQPAWFNKSFKACIPDCFIPDRSQEALRRETEGGLRQGTHVSELVRGVATRQQEEADLMEIGQQHSDHLLTASCKK